MDEPENEDLCRCCLRGAHFAASVFSHGKQSSKFYAEMLRECCSLEVLQGDGLPSKICLKCIGRLHSAHKFRNICLQTNSVLITKFTTRKIKSLKTETDTIGSPEPSDPIETTEDEMFHKDIKIELEDALEGLESKEDLDLPLAKLEFSEAGNVTLPLKKHFWKDYSAEAHDVGKSEGHMSEDQKLDSGIAYRSEADSNSKSQGSRKQCTICNLTFDTKIKYYNHRYSFHSAPQTCDICTTIFKTKRAFERHKNGVHGISKFTCHYCSKTFHRKDGLCIHIKLHTERSPPRCNICDLMFRNKNQLNGHNRRRHSDKLERLGNAAFAEDRTNGAVNRMLREKQRRPGAIKTLCHLCDRKFKTTRKLQEHINWVHLGIKYYCNICKKSYTSERNHKEMVHSPPCICVECDITFSNRVQYVTHMNKVHRNPGTVSCDVCHAVLANKSVLGTHKRALHSDTKFICQYCSRVFTRKHRLEEHVRRHTKEKLYECEMCTKRFVTKGALKNHLFAHTDEKKAKCHICSAMFKSKNTLRVHIASHDEKHKRHACAVCGKRFQRTDHRNIHQRNVHKLQEPTTDTSARDKSM